MPKCSGIPGDVRAALFCDSSAASNGKDDDRRIKRGPRAGSCDVDDNGSQFSLLTAELSIAADRPDRRFSDSSGIDVPGNDNRSALDLRSMGDGLARLLVKR